MNFPHIYKEGTDGRGLYYMWFRAMHTRIDVMMAGEFSEESFNRVGNEIRSAVSYIEHIGSCFDPDSELSRVNREATEHPVNVDEELLLILRLCKEYHRLTNGLFDITRAGKMEALILTNDGKVEFSSPLNLNLSGFLKGYALENVRSILSEQGINDALVNMGNSSIMAIGSYKGTYGWEVAIDDHAPDTQQSSPNDQHPTPRKTVTLYDECLTISGNSSGERQHIINPLTDEYVVGKRAVGVVTRSGIEGEALSTALFIADANQREALKEQFGIKIIIDL